MAIFNTVVNGSALQELSDPATSEYITEGKEAYNADGELIVGTYQHPTALIVNGHSIPIVECDSEGVAPELTATVNDIRQGKTAVTNQGVVTGELEV